MTWRVTGRLVAEGDDAQAPLSEYRVEAVFRRADIESPARSRGRANVWERLRAAAFDGPGTSAGSAPAVEAHESSSTVTGDDGGFTLTLPDRSELAGPVELVASAPSGVRVAGVSVALDAPDAAVEMPVEPLKSIAASGPAVAPPRTYHVNGRVFDRDGRCLPDCMQIVLSTRRSAAADAPLVPLLAQHLDASGYFFGDLPDVALESLTAHVSVFREPVPLRLVNGRATARLVVVGALDEERVDAAAGHDCACGGERALPRAPSQVDLVDASDAYTTDLGSGRCIDFTVPNRAIDEFDFYSVVRTTEPEIRGITLEDPEWQTTRPAGEVPADDDGPVDAGAVLARSWEVVLLTGARGTWGVVRVFVTTDDGRRLLVLSKRSANDVGGLLPNEGNPAVAEVVLQPNSSRTFPVTTSEATGLDLATVTGVEVEWVESNTGDAWGFQGIGMVALTRRGRVPLLINDATLFRNDPEIRLFDNSGGTPLVWSASAAVGAVPGPAGGPAPPAPAPAPAPAGPGMAVRPAGRTRLAPETAVDWDSSPTFYEAASVAHGHLLHYKQVWHADGYSLGDLLYSLPLAPGQKKLISVTDWERSERTTRTEDTVADEMVAADLARDRDLREVVTGALTESSRGGSKNTTTGVGVGTGAAGNGSYEAFNFGALLGVSGGYGGSDSSAWQVSARDLSTSSLQTLRDRTLQSASAVRGLRSSVVQTVSQGESTRVTTEVVANHNHCHAMTVQYFEVLRHLRVTHELADVQECLFVPLPMFPFDRPKSLRWRDALTPYLSRPELGPGFDAARRVQTNWSEVDSPAARYSDEMMLSLGGEMDLTVMIPLPPMPVRPPPDPEDPVDTAKAVTEALNPTTGFLGVLTAIATGGASLIAAATTSAVTDATKAVMTGARGLAEDLYAQESPEERYARFHNDVMPGVAAGFVDQLQLWGVIRGALVRITSADFTLVSEYRPGTPLLVTVRADLPAGTRRRDLQQLVVRSTSGLPSGCRAIVNTASFRYRTRLFEHALLDDRRANDDIDLPGVQVDFDATTLLPRVTTTSQGAGATLSTPTDAWEARNPRDEDRRLSAELLDHLNDNIDFYHHAMWWTMDPNRRFMLLDGHVAPGSGNRSIASVVENRLIGIIGNSLVLPVAQGVTLDPRFAAGGASLREAYELDPPVPPARVSLPTRGVFAEAVMGSCNACEQVDDSRFWRWEESPIDEPPAIEAASTASRRAEPPAVTPTEFPPPIVSIQNAPAIPDPAGVGAALDAITRQSFADITGLAGTQANAAAAYAKAMDNALAFGKEASALAQAAGMQKGGIQKSMGAIDKAESEGKIDTADARRLRVAALEKMIGGTPADDDTMSREAIEGLTDKAGENDASVKVERPGSSLEIDARQPGDGGGDEVASSAELPEGLKLRKGLLPSKGVTPAKKVATVLSLFGDAPIATAADVNQIFGAIGTAGVSSYLSWLRSRAALLGMDRRVGFQAWQRGDAGGGGVKQFNFNWGPAAEAGFEAFWDGIATMYAPHTTINIVEFLALDLATHIEGYGDYAIVSEAQRERFGLDYFFEADWVAPNGKVVAKRSYNQAPNRTARALFADADFAAAHDVLLPAGGPPWNRGAAAWSGVNYAATGAPTDVRSADTEFIRQADFYKFRGRGWIQTTNRDNYRDLAKVLREEIDSIPDPMWSSVATWAAVGASDAAFDKSLTQSRDSEWNDLFVNTGGAVAWLGVRTFSRTHGDCLYISPPVPASLNGNAQGSVGLLGDRINGYGGALREAVRRVLLQMYDSLT